MQPLRFADYDLVHFLGRGGMGEVWSAVKRSQFEHRELATAQVLALDSVGLVADPKALNKPVALKVMHPTLSEDEEYRKMFMSEGSITMQLSSANIVQVLDIDEHEGLLYMVMERIDGVNLSDFQQRVLTAGGLMPLDIVVRIVHEILVALFVAHEHIVAKQPEGIIHRDVKPGNVLVSSVGDIRLTDFGIARRLSSTAAAHFTQGTPRYMAPEQTLGMASKASDLFAVGAIFHELLTGRRFRDDCRTAEDLARTPFVVPPLDREIPRVLDDVRRGLLDPDPTRRIASAREALTSLAAWVVAGNTRLKTADLYEQVVGSRSSGFTRSHQAALPSFILQRRFGFESALTVPVIHRGGMAPEPEPPPSALEDDVTLTFERFPWLDEPSEPAKLSEPSELSASASSGCSGPETNAPLKPRCRREVAVHHRAATLQEVGARFAAKAGTEVPAITPTEALVPPFASVSPPQPRTPLLLDPTEPLPPPYVEQPKPTAAPQRPTPEDPAELSSDTRDRYAVAGVIRKDQEHEVTDRPQAEDVARPRLPSETRATSTTRIVTACVIAAAIFVAGIATALLVQGGAPVPPRESTEGP